MKRTNIDTALASQLANTLRQRGPLAGLEADVLARFVRLGALIALDPGEALMREGEVASEFYLLLEGALVVQAQGGTLARLDRPGDVVGEAAVLLSSKRTADVIAESPVRAIEIPGELLVLSEFREVSAGIRGTMLRDEWVQY